MTSFFRYHKVATQIYPTKIEKYATTQNAFIISESSYEHYDVIASPQAWCCVKWLCLHSSGPQTSASYQKKKLLKVSEDSGSVSDGWMSSWKSSEALRQRSLELFCSAALYMSVHNSKLLADRWLILFFWINKNSVKLFHFLDVKFQMAAVPPQVTVDWNSYTLQLCDEFFILFAGRKAASEPLQAALLSYTCRIISIFYVSLW